MAIISIANQKGGVGKSTAVINLASAFALKAAWRNPQAPGRVLVVDMDPQCNTIATLSGGIFSQDQLELPDVELADYLVFRTSHPLVAAILTSHLPQRAPENLDYVYSTSPSMKAVRNELAGSGAADAGFRLADTLQEIAGSYDHIFIDTGPAEDWLTTNALVASTHVVFPIEPAGFSIQGIEENFLYVDTVQRRMNTELQIAGILPSRFHTQYGTQQDILALINRNYSDLILPVVAERSSVYDAVQAGLDIFSFKPARKDTTLRSSDPATQEFAAVADELERRLG
jgi:chromosome partitioning protein